MIQKYTEHDRQKIAAREYTEYTKDDPIDIGTDNNPNVIGTVRQVIENETGIKVYVVESPDRPLWYTISKSVHDIFLK